MEDNKIIELYRTRSENAISETEKKYGRYCHSIAFNILYDHGEAEECVNDTYFGAWNSIPPKVPDILSAFLGKITRNAALHVYEKKKRKKRGAGEVELALSELAECTDMTSDVEEQSDCRELEKAVTEFLDSLESQKRTFNKIIYGKGNEYFGVPAEVVMSYQNQKIFDCMTVGKYRDITDIIDTEKCTAQDIEYDEWEKVFYKQDENGNVFNKLRSRFHTDEELEEYNRKYLGIQHAVTDKVYSLGAVSYKDFRIIQPDYFKDLISVSLNYDEPEPTHLSMYIDTNTFEVLPAKLSSLFGKGIAKYIENGENINEDELSGVITNIEDGFIYVYAVSANDTERFEGEIKIPLDAVKKDHLDLDYKRPDMQPEV